MGIYDKPPPKPPQMFWIQLPDPVALPPRWLLLPYNRINWLWFFGLKGHERI